MNPGEGTWACYLRPGPMNLELTRSLLSALGRDVRLFGYCGRFIDEHSAQLIELGGIPAKGDAPSAVIKGRLGYIMVEAFQNVLRHRAGSLPGGEWGPGRAIFLLRTGEERQVLCTSNVVTDAQAERLGRLLITLKDKDNPELKKLFLEGIQRAGAPEQRGAGLGLIEMVRRSAGPPHWSFAQLGEGHQLFTLTLDIVGTGGEEQPFAGLAGLRALLTENRVLLFHAGDWSADLGRVLLKVARSEMAPKAGRPSDREAVWGLVASVALPLFLPRPICLVLHGEGAPMLSIGGFLSKEQAGGLHAAMRGTDVEFSFGDGPDADYVLAVVHVPW